MLRASSQVIHFLVRCRDRSNYLFQVAWHITIRTGVINTDNTPLSGFREALPCQGPITGDCSQLKTTWPSPRKANSALISLFSVQYSLTEVWLWHSPGKDLHTLLYATSYCYCTCSNFFCVHQICMGMMHTASLPVPWICNQAFSNKKINLLGHLLCQMMLGLPSIFDVMCPRLPKAGEGNVRPESQIQPSRPFCLAAPLTGSAPYPLQGFLPGWKCCWNVIMSIAWSVGGWTGVWV